MIYEQAVFAAELATITRISARVLGTRMGGYVGSVNASSIPHDLVVLAQPSKNCLVDALPNASFHPFVEPAPTSHITAAAEFARQIFPWYPGLDYKQDCGQGRAIIDARAAAFRRWMMGRKMSCDKGGAGVFGKNVAGHGISPSTNTDAMLVP